MRVLTTSCLVCLCLARAASAQEQERKLIDRLLKPDMSLQNSLQQKQFVARGTTSAKQARTKAFHVSDRRAEKQFANRNVQTKEFGTNASRDDQRRASLATRADIPKAEVRYAAAAFTAGQHRDAGKTVQGREFASSRPFLIEGKSQKALSQRDRPLTIDEVRELLNKNK